MKDQPKTKKEAKPNEEVIVFGQSVKTDKDDNTEGVVWGFLLLSAGIVFLFQTMGVVTEQIWNDVWPMWPVLLILFGVRIIIGNIPMARFLMFTISLAVFGTFLIFLFNNHAPQLVNWVPESVDQYVNIWEQVKR